MKNKKINGVTLVELMVVVALMAIIFIPLVRIFKSFTNAWWAGKARMTIQAEARDAMYWFTKDMKSTYRHTIGNLVRNGGFDSPDNISSSITGWEEATAGVLPLGVLKFSSATTRGFCAELSAGAIFSSTITFQLQGGVKYILTGKIWNTGGSFGRIEVMNSSLTTMYAGTETLHVNYWETVTANPNTGTPPTNGPNVDSNGVLTMPSTQNCVIRLSNNAGGKAYFENISVTPKMAVLVGSAGVGEWQVSPNAGYPFVSEMQTETGYTKYLARYKIEVTTDSANILRNRIWRQKAKSDTASFSNQNDWESIDYNHIAEYCDELKIGYDVPTALLAQSGTDTGISMELVFRRAAGGSVMQPYSMKTYIYPQSP